MTGICCWAWPSEWEWQIFKPMYSVSMYVESFVSFSSLLLVLQYKYVHIAGLSLTDWLTNYVFSLS